jgi:glycosyltransferase involved in cell wall biosynthesis
VATGSTRAETRADALARTGFSRATLISDIAPTKESSLFRFRESFDYQAASTKLRHFVTTRRPASARTFSGVAPKLSIITPSFNQAAFIERTILSVLNQNYPNLEYIIIDGASTDGTVEIIKKYERHLAYWVSERDRGQSHALNKGIAMATGEWVGWQNSDDLYFPGAFQIFADGAIAAYVDILQGTQLVIDEHDNVVHVHKYYGASKFSILAEGMIFGNQSSFIRRKALQAVGEIDETLSFVMDWDLYARLLISGARIQYRDVIMGASRVWAGRKTTALSDESRAEHWMLLERMGLVRPDSLRFGARRIFSKFLRTVTCLASGDVAYALSKLNRKTAT